MGRQPIVIRSRFVPRRFCVNIFGTLWVRDRERLNDRLINHERIHTAQMRELLFVPFYILYFFEWLFRLIKLRNWYSAYEAISMEREAYANDNNLNYLSTRKPFSQWRKQTKR